jgi:uncharacterized short protein YbdD (DUF466 family)
MSTLARLLNARRCWDFIRELSGDDAYERYLQHLAAEHPEQTPVDRKTFFQHEQQRKWEGVNRCC